MMRLAGVLLVVGGSVANGDTGKLRADVGELTASRVPKGESTDKADHEVAKWLQTAAFAKCLASETLPRHVLAGASWDGGKVDARVTVAKPGTTGRVRGDDEPEGNPLANCIQKAIEALTPPPGKGGLRTTIVIHRGWKKPPAITFGAFHIVGGDPKATEASVRSALAEYETCYRRRALVEPTLGGTISLTLFVTPNGTVSSAAGSGVNVRVANCIAEVAKAVEYLRIKEGGGSQVSVKLTLTPGS
jgi:hypothetical protein